MENILRELSKIHWRITDPDFYHIRANDSPTMATPNLKLFQIPLPVKSLKLYFPYGKNLISLQYGPLNLMQMFDTIYTFYYRPVTLEDVQNNPVLLSRFQNRITVRRSDVLGKNIYFRGLSPYKDGYLIILKG